MSTIFSKYPSVLYKNQIATDILSRIILREKYTNKLQLYYEYDLQEGDSPEIVAAKFYGDPYKSWIILILNEIINPYFDFPLSYLNFIAYLNKKYEAEGAALNMRGADYAAITINPDPLGYSVDIITTDETSGVTTTNQLYIDETAFNEQYQNPIFNYINSPNSSITYNKKIITIYDYESSINESKRKIKLLQTKYVDEIEMEFSSLMKIKYK